MKTKKEKQLEIELLVEKIQRISKKKVTFVEAKENLSFKESVKRNILKEEVYPDEQINLLVKKLTEKKIPCRVKVADDQTIILLGAYYPDSLCDKVYDILESLGMEAEICADYSGGSVQKNISINGGPKRY